MHESSTLDISLSAITHNMRVLRRIVGDNCRLCPIVKADAYGLGAVRIARTLAASGADMLAAYTPAQATALIQSAVGLPILILMPVRAVERTDELYRWLICGRLHLAVHDRAHLADLTRMAERFGATLPVHLEIDTGMGRGGCGLEEAPELLQEIAQHPRLKLAGLFSHFADAESNHALTEQQLAQFDQFVDAQADALPADGAIHLASTHAALRAHRYHKSMVRIGLAWAGYGLDDLESGEVLTEGQELEPCLTWRSAIVQVRPLPKGATVGYGARWTAQRASVLGLVPVGYADGFPVGAGARDDRPEGASVAVLVPDSRGIERRFVPVVGAVNMDQISIDLTDIAAEFDESAIDVGTRVELISPDPTAPNHLPRLAALGGTFSHEMLCRLNPRLKRGYVTNVQSDRPAAPARAAAAAG